MNSTEGSLKELCATRQICECLEDYLLFCASSESEERTLEDNVCSDGKNKCKTGRKAKSSACFPNVAGFCRFLGVGTGELEKLASEYPDEYGKILAVLEDEALNSGLSATLLSAYLKKRLGYDMPQKNHSESTQLEISFEHNIMEDGE
jgi:hypothetical protein